MYRPSKPFYSMNISELKRYVKNMSMNYPMDDIKKRKVLKIKIKKHKTRRKKRRKNKRTRKVLMLTFDKTKSLKHI